MSHSPPPDLDQYVSYLNTYLLLFSRSSAYHGCTLTENYLNGFRADFETTHPGRTSNLTKAVFLIKWASQKKPLRLLVQNRDHRFANEMAALFAVFSCNNVSPAVLDDHESFYHIIETMKSDHDLRAWLAKYLPA